jgi:hypothetical protein
MSDSTISSKNDTPKSKVFNSQEFMEFLSKQDISKLAVLTTSGTLLSASFNDGSTEPIDPAIFKSTELFKSMDSTASAKSEDSPPQVSLRDRSSKISTSVSNACTSKDWLLDYKDKHVDVTYSPFFLSTTEPKRKPSIIPSTALPPKKRPGKTDWNAMYASALSPLVEAAAQAAPAEVPGGPQKHSTLTNTKTCKASSGKSKRKPRKIIPEVKDYVVDVYRDTDVLFGRGGRSNHHEGNKLYRDKVIEMQPHYRMCDKNEKTKVAQTIVDSINKEHNGRFLELDKEADRWYIVPNVVARRKVGQALRENNTEEARAAKREKYGQMKGE